MIDDDPSPSTGAPTDGGTAVPDASPPTPATWPPEGLGDAFALRFKVPPKALSEAFQAVRLPHAGNRVTLGVTDQRLVLSCANADMRCWREIPLCEPSGLPAGCVVELETTVRLFDEILCDRGRFPAEGSKDAAEIGFATVEDVSRLEAIEAVAQARALAIRDGALRITWGFQVGALRPWAPRLARATAVDTTPRALGAAVELVRGYAAHGTGNAGHARVRVSDGTASARTGRAGCVARLPGLGAAHLDLDADAAAVLARLAAHFVPPTRAWAGPNDQGLEDAAGECVVLSKPLGQGASPRETLPPASHVVHLTAERFGRAVARILTQLPRGDGEVELHLSAGPPSTTELVLAVPVALGSARVACSVDGSEHCAEECPLVPFEGVLKASHVGLWKFHGIGAEVELRVLESHLYIREHGSDGEVETFLPWVA